MADNRIRVLIDVVKDNASKNLASLKKDFADADTASGKFKVATGGALDFVKQNAAGFAAGAAAALGTFAVKSVAAFQETALEAGKFADATGIATEDASRWIEVAGDIGVSGDAVQGAFQKMNKAIADGKLGEFSDQLVRAKDGTVDASASFVNIATTIGKIQDPTERAQAAQKAFGKSYGEIAELMEMDATSLRKALDDVSSAKVIDAGEVKRAREFRAAMDNLKDAGEDLALTLGEALVPVLTDLAETVGKVTGPLSEASDAVGGFGDIISKQVGYFIGLKNPVDDLIDGIGDLISNEKEVVEWTGVTAQSMTVAGSATADLTFEARDAARGQKELAGEVEKTTRKIAEQKTGIDILNGALSRDDAKVAFIEAQQEMAAAASGTADEQVAAARRAIDATVNYIDTLGGIPASKATSIEALIDEGSYAEAQRRLLILARNISVSVGIEARGGAGYGGRTGGARAAGGPVYPNTMHPVVENGPELLQVGNETMLMMGNRGGNVVPMSAGGRGGAGGGGGVVVNINALDAASFSPSFIQRLANEIERAQQRTGRVWQRQAG